MKFEQFPQQKQTSNEEELSKMRIESEVQAEERAKKLRVNEVLHKLFPKTFKKLSKMDVLMMDAEIEDKLRESGDHKNINKLNSSDVVLNHFYIPGIIEGQKLSFIDGFNKLKRIINRDKRDLSIFRHQLEGKIDGSPIEIIKAITYQDPVAEESYRIDDQLLEEQKIKFQKRTDGKNLTEQELNKIWEEIQEEFDKIREEKLGSKVISEEYSGKINGEKLTPEEAKVLYEEYQYIADLRDSKLRDMLN